MVYQKLGSSRRGFNSRMSYHIEHRIITLMPDTCNDRQGKLSTIGSKLVSIEARQIGRSTTPPDDYYNIPVFALRIDFFQRTDNGTFHTVALHNSREQTRIKDKTKRIMSQLIAEIAIASRCSRRNDSDPLRQFRQLQLFVQRQDTFFVQSFQDFFPAECHIAQRICRINIKNSQRITIQFVKIDTHLYQHLDTRNKRLSRFPLKIGLQRIIYIAPDNPPCLRN